MALPPKFKAFRLAFTGSSTSGSTLEPEPEPLHTIEVYLDYVCPFSASKYLSWSPNIMILGTSERNSLI